MSSPLVALVFGANGLVGKFIVNLLLGNGKFTQVRVVTRRTMNIQNDKFDNIIIKDFGQMTRENGKEAFQGVTHIFCSLGTTRSKAGSAEEFFKVDHDYVINIARISKHFETIKWFGYVSSFGANSNSYFLYPRTKGQVEEDLFAQNLPRVQIYRPGFLLGTREGDSRYWESVAIAIVKVLRWFSPKNIAIEADILAKAMIWDSLHPSSDPSNQSFAIIGNSEIIDKGELMDKSMNN
jgi:oxidoreductase